MLQGINEIVLSHDESRDISHGVGEFELNGKTFQAKVIDRDDFEEFGKTTYYNIIFEVEEDGVQHHFCLDVTRTGSYHTEYEHVIGTTAIRVERQEVVTIKWVVPQNA